MATSLAIYPIEAKHVRYPTPGPPRPCLVVSSGGGIPDLFIPCFACSAYQNRIQYHRSVELLIFGMLSSHFRHIRPSSLLDYVNDYMKVVHGANDRRRCSSFLQSPAIRDSPIERAIMESFEELRPSLKRATQASVDSLLASTIEDGDHRDCVICMEDIVARKSRALTMPCSHVFHQSCLLQWLKNSNVCPLCRFEMPSES